MFVVAKCMGYFTPRHISSSRAHSNKVPTAIPFPVSSFSIVPLPVSHAVDISQKSKMAVAKMKCTDFTAIWLKEDNFLCTVSDFIVHVHNEKKVDDTVTPETGSSFNLG